MSKVENEDHLTEIEWQEVYRQYPVLERLRKAQKNKEEQAKAWIEKIRAAKWVSRCLRNECSYVLHDKMVFISEIPAELLRDSYDIWFEIVKSKGDFLLDVPTKFRDYDMMERAIESDGTMIQYIKKERQDENLVKKAVLQNGMALKFVVPERQTPEIIKTAIEQNVAAIQYAPFMCVDFCDLALKKNKTAMMHVNPEFFSKEIVAYLLSFDDIEIAKTIPLVQLNKFIMKEVLNLK